KLPIATEAKNNPIICPCIPFGASLVIEDNPTGLSASSPKVSSNKLPTSHNGDAKPPSLVKMLFEANIINEKPAAVINIPSANLVILLGSRPRLPSLTQTILTMGASNKINNGFNDWNQILGISNPKTFK